MKIVVLMSIVILLDSLLQLVPKGFGNDGEYEGWEYVKDLVTIFFDKMILSVLSLQVVIVYAGIIHTEFYYSHEKSIVIAHSIGNPYFIRFCKEHNYHLIHTTCLSDGKNFNLIALHECCHFLFFNMYELLFGKCDKEEYDYPSDLWLLSELIIDPILNKDFYTRIIGEEIKAYDYFYDIIIDGKNLVECIQEIFEEKLEQKQCIEKCIKFIKINSNCINNC